AQVRGHVADAQRLLPRRLAQEPHDGQQPRGVLRRAADLPKAGLAHVAAPLAAVVVDLNEASALAAELQRISWSELGGERRRVLPRAICSALALPVTSVRKASASASLRRASASPWLSMRRASASPSACEMRVTFTASASSLRCWISFSLKGSTCFMASSLDLA